MHQNLMIPVWYSGEWCYASLEFLKWFSDGPGQLNTYLLNTQSVAGTLLDAGRWWKNEQAEVSIRNISLTWGICGICRNADWTVST